MGGNDEPALKVHGTAREGQVLEAWGIFSKTTA